LSGDESIDGVDATDFEGEFIVTPGAEGPIEVFMVTCGEGEGVSEDVEAIGALHKDRSAAEAVVFPEGEVTSVACDDTGESD